MDKQSSYQMSRDISIAVSNLKTWCIIGVYPFERIVPQQLCVSAVCTMQLATSELQDDISGTLDYTIDHSTVYSAHIEEGTVSFT